MRARRRRPEAATRTGAEPLRLLELRVVELDRSRPAEHLDHDPENCEYDNLKAMCQKCHNKYDRAHRNHTRKKTISATKFKNQLKLF